MPVTQGYLRPLNKTFCFGLNTAEAKTFHIGTIIPLKQLTWNFIIKYTCFKKYGLNYYDQNLLQVHNKHFSKTKPNVVLLPSFKTQFQKLRSTLAIPEKVKLNYKQKQSEEYYTKKGK